MVTIGKSYAGFVTPMLRFRGNSLTPATCAASASATV